MMADNGGGGWLEFGVFSFWVLLFTIFFIMVATYIIKFAPK